ncbi:MAG: site-specific DNA-methyltransferase [Bacteroidales bacterium]|nr:site-specific DNA-methyltransferase [Bacteroidales bacterium]MBP3202296.1 site-specific DNA-methyltransferase [Bacteroidales bacterium]
MPKSEVYNCDCMDYMKTLPDKAFSLAIADPPYGIGISKSTSLGKKSSAKTLTYYPKNNWDNNIPSKAFFTELFRISENQIIFGANYFCHMLPPSPCWVVWDKLQPEDISFAMAELIYTSFRRSTQMVRVSRAFIGNKVSNNEYLAQKWVKIHPTQKPICLYSWILNKFANKGDTIFDPMMGSQSSRIAAYKMGFDYVGCELDSEYFERGGGRFEKECLGKEICENGITIIQQTLF